MMTDIRLNSNGDIDISGSVISLTDPGAESTAQRLFIKLRTFKTEWVYNTDFGVDYFGKVFTKGPAKALVDAEFRSKIVNTPGVSQLIRFTSTINQATREYTLDFTVVDESGETFSLTI